MQNLSLFESNSQPLTLDNHLSFNFNDYVTPNLNTFTSLTHTKSYVPITGCVLEYITASIDLSNLEKLFHLFTNSLAFINKKTNTVGSRQRSVSLPSKTWAKLLNCSRSQVFSLQQSLERKGYLLITRDKNKYTQNKRNLLTPTLPESVFKSLCKAPDKLGEEHLAYDSFNESKLEYLDRTKLFIPLNYGLLKVISSNEDLSPLQKVIWLDFYAKCYKCHISSNRTSGFSFITSYEELMERYECSRASLSKAMTVLENNNFIAKNRFFVKKNHALEDRQDKSLWQITLFMPASYNLELINIKDRKSITIEPDYLEKSNNNIEELLISSEKIIFKENSVNYRNNKTHSIADDYYINNVLEEITDIYTYNDISTNSLVNSNNTLTIGRNDAANKILDLPELQDDISSPDPHVSKSSLHINKDLILKIKEFKSNLRAKPKVLFNDFFKKLKKDDNTVDKETIKNQKSPQEFNICSELIREKLKTLSKDKADKARKFAYSIVSKKLAMGYAATIGKHELAKQLIHHAATWKPTKLGNISRDKEIDAALAVAWKSIIKGTWQPPLEWAKAEVLNYEFRYYRKKYQESKVMSHEVKSLEVEVNKLLGGWCNLEGKIIEESKYIGNKENPTALLLTTDLKSIQKDNTDKDSMMPSESNETMMNNNYYLEKYPKYRPLNNCNINLSNLSEEQRHIALRGSDNEIMEITTADNKQYFGKLKAIEVDENGELIMTFIPSSQKEFIKNKEIFTLNTGNTISDLHSKNKQLTCNQYNTTESCRNDIEFTQGRTQGFTSLNEAVSGIFDKLPHIKSDSS